ncbi:MAG: anti-sigma factor [Acidobacteriota bacterium]
MNCKNFEENLSNYLDGLLSKSESSQFAAHALQCRDCRMLMDEIKVALGEVKDEMDVPVELENSLFSIQADLAPLDCSEFEELITDFLDGFVPASTYHKFENHAESCTNCSSLLTEVVYAVAACHSVHSFEEIEVSAELESRLLALLPGKTSSLKTRLANQMAAFAAALMPRNTQSRRWSYATASGLSFAVFTLMLMSFSDDGTLSGVFREIQSKAASLYSQSTELYAQKNDVLAEIKKVRSDLGDMWQTLGGETEFEAANSATAESPKHDLKHSNGTKATNHKNK